MSNLRAPAVPLITVDPSFNIWSCRDNLYDDVTRHWTGSRQNILGVLKIDGFSYRFMGKVFADGANDEFVHIIPQTNVEILPMRTIYTFQNDIARLTLTFMTPLLTDDLKLMTRPVSYISYDIEILDGKEHKMSIFFGLSTEIGVDVLDQTLTAETYENGAFCGRGDRDVLAGSGDNRRNDWGYVHIFAREGYEAVLEDAYEINKRFRPSCGYRDADALTRYDLTKEFPADRAAGFIGLIKDIEISDKFSDFICTAYDDIHSIMYFNKPIDAYYKKDGDTFEDVCKMALNEYDEILAKVIAAEKDLLEKANKISPKYADIVSLAYRQVIAAHKLTWDGEEIQFLSKECYSNGCIGTLDVTYPSIPMFLLYNPYLIEGMLNPLFKYVASGKWPYKYAPHDVGQYPLANGQVYSLNRETGELFEKDQMPIEECGNAILCVYALCRYKKDFAYAQKHMDILKQWTEYLVENGIDPENQLCTDDFAGHLAHNCNLSAKAIMGIAAFGKILEALGDGESCERYMGIAKDLAAQWKKMASDGDHYRLAFDRKDTWSIKYNMVWDKIFGWNVFDADIFDTEIDYYKNKFNPYGLPLDSRKDYTKSDWLMWSTRLNNDKEYESKIIDTMWDMLNTSYTRVPFADWYYTSEARQVSFQNRTVQGGLFINLI